MFELPPLTVVPICRQWSPLRPLVRCGRLSHPVDDSSLLDLTGDRAHHARRRAVQTGGRPRTAARAAGAVTVAARRTGSVAFTRAAVHTASRLRRRSGTVSDRMRTRVAAAKTSPSTYSSSIDSVTNPRNQEADQRILPDSAFLLRPYADTLTVQLRTPPAQINDTRWPSTSPMATRGQATRPSLSDHSFDSCTRSTR